MAATPQREFVEQSALKWDTVCVQSNAKDFDSGWFNDFPTFAKASTIKFFVDRNSSVPEWATSQNSDRTDWAFEAHQMGIEFFAPAVDTIRNVNPVDNYLAEVWTTLLPRFTSFSLRLADTDQVLKLPGCHAPGGVGPHGMIRDGSDSPIMIPPTNGIPDVANSWKFPAPIKIAMRSTAVVETRIEEPVLSLLSVVTGPGSKIYPTGPVGGAVFIPNTYGIRVWLRGRRFIDQIGARG